MLIKTPDAVYPVDFKYTKGRPHKNHIYQLCGYALILEDIEKQKVEKGFIYLIPQEDAIVCDLNSKLKADTLRMMEDIRKMIEKELIPDPTPIRNKCIDCEYRNYCGDIF
jgi:CRISPR-associated exonuclease Cas4